MLIEDHFMEVEDILMVVEHHIMLSKQNNIAVEKTIMFVEN